MKFSHLYIFWNLLLFSVATTALALTEKGPKSSIDPYLNHSVSVRLYNDTLAEALEEISCALPPGVLPSMKSYWETDAVVTLDLQSTPLKEVLDKVAEKFGVRWEKSDGRIEWTRPPSPTETKPRFGTNLLYSYGTMDQALLPILALKPDAMKRLHTLAAEKNVYGESNPIRVRALQALATNSDDQIFKSLLSFIKTEPDLWQDNDLHSAIMATLFTSYDSDRVKEVTDVFKYSNSMHARCDAAHILAVWRDPKASETLLSSLSTSDPYVRSSAAYALRRIRDHGIIPDLIGMLGDETRSGFATEALSGFRTDRSMKALETASNDPAKQAAVFRIFANIRNPKGLETLKTMANTGKTPAIRNSAFFQLASVRPSAISGFREFMLERLKDPSADIREIALTALLNKYSDDSEIITVLIQHMADEKEDTIRKKIITMMGKNMTRPDAIARIMEESKNDPDAATLLLTLADTHEKARDLMLEIILSPSCSLASRQVLLTNVKLKLSDGYPSKEMNAVIRVLQVEKDAGLHKISVERLRPFEKESFEVGEALYENAIPIKGYDTEKKPAQEEVQHTAH